VQDGQEKGCSLAAACLRAREDVAAGHRSWNGVGLNRRGSRESEFTDSFE
jgi:hypothetical protein